MPRLTSEPSHYAHMRTASVALASLGVLTIALGFYMTGPRLVQYASEYLSDDKVLSEASQAWLHTFRMKIIAAGVLLAVASILTKYAGPLAVSGFRRAEALLRDNIRDYFEATISFIGKGLGRLFRLAATETGMWCFVLLILVTLSIPAIFWSPAGAFHVEALDLEPAKNLVRHGVYATLTNRGFDEFTHRSSAGPGIILLNALLFKLVGISAYASRALHVGFVIGNIVLFYLMARKLYGRKVAIVGVYIFTPTVLLLSRGATAMGPEAYTAALFYTMAAALLWQRAIETNKDIYLIGSGLFFGFAFQTKWLFLFALIALMLTCGLLRLTKKELGNKYWLVPVLMVGLVTLAWVDFRIANLGLRQEIMHLQLFWNEHMHRAVGLSTQDAWLWKPWEMIRPLATLTQTDYNRVDLWGDLQFFLIIPAILYAMIIVARNELKNYLAIYWLAFSLVWFAWWFFFNYDLAETHVLTFVQISQLFIAKLLVDLWEHFSARKDTFLDLMRNQETRKNAVAYVLRVGIVCIILGKVFIPLAEKAGALYTRNITLTIPHKEMMAYIKHNTESNAVFSGWDWSMPWYVDLDDDGDHLVKDRSINPPVQREAAPEYFIVNPEWPIEKLTDEWPYATPDTPWHAKENERRKKFLEEQCTFLKAFGGNKHKWLLYRVNNDALGPAPGRKDRSGLS